LVAKVAEDRPKRGQEGPRCAKIEAKRGPKGLPGPMGKPKGRGSGLPRGSKILIRKLGESDSEVRSEAKCHASEVPEGLTRCWTEGPAN